MPGYPKIWTTILHEPWFIEMNCTQRGVFLQLILLAKEHGDTGLISARSLEEFSGLLSVERRTLGKYLEEFTGKKLITYAKYGKHLLTVNLLKYKKYQGIKPFGEIGGNSHTKKKEEERKTEEGVSAGEYLWINITQKEYDNLESTYPYCNIDNEIAKADQWCDANPNRRPKNYYRFLVNWFNKIIPPKKEPTAEDLYGKAIN